jgi:integrase
MYVRLAVDSWMRPEELAGLQIRDVLDDGAVLHVRRVLVKGKDRRKLVYEDRPKTARSNRYVDLSGDTAAHLLTYLAAHRQRALKWFTDHPEAAHPGKALPLFVGVGEFRRGERQRKTALTSTGSTSRNR